MNISDDILIFAKTIEEHDSIVEKVFKRLRDHNLTVNKDKCQFRQTEIVYFGHKFTKGGYTATMESVEAIVTADRPNNEGELRSFLGSSNYVARFIRNYSDLTHPLRKLLHKDEKFQWKQDQKDAFLKLKSAMSDPKTLRYYDVNLRTELVVDASPWGLGAILTQIDKNGYVNVCGYASTSLTETEQRYSQTEREALAVSFACVHFEFYLRGCPEFLVISDHKPLEGIMNNPVSHPTPRLERICLRLQPYCFKLQYRPGKTNQADYLSRHPMKSRSQKSRLDRDIEFRLARAITVNYTDGQIGLGIEEIKKETKRDEVLLRVMDAVTQNNVENLNGEEFQPFRNVLEELSTPTEC